jgi:hypothetical protein
MINKGKVKTAIRCCLYGVEGIGKSTIAANMPKPVFLDMEDGTLNMDVARFDRPTDMTEVYKCLEYFKTSEYQTVVVDTIDWLERVILEGMLKEFNKTSIEDWGYGKGYTMLKEATAKFLDVLDDLKDSGKHVVLLAHAHIKKFEEPDGMGAYDRYELKLSRQVSPLIKEWVDLLLFANYKTHLVDNDGKKKALGGKERTLFTSRTAAWDAKNRHDLPDEVKFDFGAIASCFDGVSNTTSASKPASNSKQSSGSSESPIEKLDRLWTASGKDQAAKVKAFTHVGCDSMDFHWDELSDAQVKKLIKLL